MFQPGFGSASSRTAKFVEADAAGGVDIAQ
jgi:hypothetical protein